MGSKETVHVRNTHRSPLLRLAISGVGAVVAGALATAPALPALAAPPSALIYVANSSSNSVNAYALGSSGNIAPTLRLQGASTGLSFPGGVAVDAAGDLFVANGNNSITEYAPGATGNVAPIKTISGPNTGLLTPELIALDAGGNLWVANAGDSTGAGAAVLEFAPNAVGNAAPISTIPAMATTAPFGVTVDSGGHTFVASRPGNSITEYGWNNGIFTPAPAISGPNTGLSEPVGVALDGSDNVFVSNIGNGTSGRTVTEYATGATGNASPVAVIGGATTGLVLPEGLALDGARNIFVADRNAQSIFEFAAGANGDVAPIATISGLNSRLSGPEGLALFMPPVTADTDLALTGVPADQTVNATGPGGAAVTYAAPTAVDEEAPPAVSCDHASGSLFAIGTTVVHCSASDSDDSPSLVSASFQITVVGAAGQLASLSAQVQTASIASVDKSLLSYILNLAIAANNAGNQPPTCVALTGFTGAVRVLEVLPPPYYLDPTIGDPWVAAANQIRAVLSC